MQTIPRKYEQNGGRNPSKVQQQQALMKDPATPDFVRFFIQQCQTRDIVDVQNYIEALARVFGVIEGE